MSLHGWTLYRRGKTFLDWSRGGASQIWEILASDDGGRTKMLTGIEAVARRQSRHHPFVIIYFYRGREFDSLSDAVAHWKASGYE